MQDKITQIVLEYFPDVQAIYLFGSFGTEHERAESDVDIALLLPLELAKHTSLFDLSDLHSALEKLLKKEIDLINLRYVSTVFQKEVIASDRRIYCSDEYNVQEFEMLTLSYYQKLNEERKEIVAEFLRTGRAYVV